MILLKNAVLACALIVFPFLYMHFIATCPSLKFAVQLFSPPGFNRVYPSELFQTMQQILVQFMLNGLDKNAVLHLQWSVSRITYPYNLDTIKAT